MKKRSTSSRLRENSQEPSKHCKKLITFDYHQLYPFLPNPKHLPTPAPTRKHKPEQRKSSLAQLCIPRRSRGQPTQPHHPFHNSILLLEYYNHDETPSNSRPKSPSPSNQKEDSTVRAVVNSSLRVITEDTNYSSNPISAQYTPRSLTQASQMQYLPYSGLLNSEHAYYKCGGRNKRTISSEESNAFVIELSAIQADGRTTVMVRNIPNKYTQEMLLKRFEVNHKKKFDFFYLPIDYNNNCNVGYAFLNFIHCKFIADFYRQFHNHKWEKFNSAKVCQVCYGRIQGTVQLERHFEHSSVLQQKEKRYRPLIGLDTLSSLVTKQRQNAPH